MHIIIIIIIIIQKLHLDIFIRIVHAVLWLFQIEFEHKITKDKQKRFNVNLDMLSI